MQAALRKYRVLDVDALVSRVEQEYTEQVREVDGFVGYYVIDGGDGNVASVTFGETQQAVDESTRRAAEWMRGSAGNLVEGPAGVTAGEVRVRVEP